MKLYYLQNQSLRAALNAAGQDYTPAYISALNAHMGVTAAPIAPDRLDSLTADDILLVGAERLDTVPSCRVILMGTGLGRDVPTPERVRHVFAHYLTEKGLALPLLVPMTAPAIEGEVVAWARDPEGHELPALIRQDNVYAFCFDLPAAIWYMADGFVPTEPSCYFFIHRTPDQRPFPDGQVKDEPFGDYLIEELESILRRWGVPTVYRLPPMEDGTLPDMAIHISGDDDCTSADFNIQAALTAEENGFPYHINAMPLAGHHFIFDRELYKELNDHGCEIALHLDFTCGVPYTFESTKAESDLFKATFGVATKTNTNHCFIQDGSTAERMRWLSDCGIMADNGFFGDLDLNNINPFDLQVYGFGTAFPRFSLDDAAHGNATLLCLQVPINYYEPRMYGEDASPVTVIHYLEGCAKNGRIAQYFIHPHYMAYSSDQRDAVLRVLALTNRHIEEKGYKVLRTTTNNLTEFWHARARVTAEATADGIAVKTEIPVFLRLPERYGKETAVCNGKESAVIHKTVSGIPGAFLYLTAGTHKITL